MRYAGLLAAAVIGLALLAFYLVRDHGGDEDKPRTVAVARARFSACMLGRAAGDVPEQRLREVMIAMHDDPSWPKRCVPYAEAIEKLDQEPDRAAALLTTDDPANMFKYEVTTLLRDDPDVALDLAAVTRDVPRPREPALPGEPTLLHAKQVDEVVGYPELAVKIGDEVACHFATKDGGLEPIARCSFLADTFTTRPSRINLVRGSVPTVLAHDYEGVAPWAGGPSLFTRPMSITPSRAGDVVFGIAKAKPTTLLVHAAGALQAVKLDRPVDPGGELTMAGDQLVFYERGHLFVRALAAKPGPVVDLGPTAPGTLGESCIGDGGTVASAIQHDKGERHLALRIGDRWKLVGPIAADREARLFCAADRAVVMSATTDNGTVRISRVDCTLDGCTPASVELKVRASVVDAIPLGDEVLLVWADDAIWSQRARLTELATAKRTPLFNGFGTSARYIPNSRLVQRIDAVRRGASTIVLLYGGGGAFGLHLRDGRVELVQVIYE